MTSPTVAHRGNLPKYAQVAAAIRRQIADGALLPGEPAPSGAELARATGHSSLTCRRALRTLVKDGALAPSPSPNGRPRVPSPAATPGERSLADAARALSESLGAHRRLAGLTQSQLAEMIAVSVTSVGHAETGRLWQSRRFWNLVDKAVGADGDLLALHDAYREADVSADLGTEVESAEPGTPKTIDSAPPTVGIAVSTPVASVTITWVDGSFTTVYAPPLAL
jgi:DNA-binding transcriptional regulator YhcF (GntR family)